MDEYIKLAFRNMRERQLRSYLTMIGVIIGVTALVSLITLGQGLEKGITEQFDKFGSNIIWVGPKSASSFGGEPAGIGTLTEDDTQTVDKLTQIDWAASMIRESMEVEYNRETKRNFIFAPDEARMRDILENVDIKLIEGRYLEEGDSDSTVIGWRVHKDMFDKEVSLKSSLLIGGEKFRVVGIKEETGSDSEDNQIMIPLSKMQEMLDAGDGISAFMAVIQKGETIDDVSLRIERELERKRNDELFEVTSPVQIADQIGEVLGIVQWVVIAIASISLIVGGLGIMNTMYSSVLERTREIGVMKAIGARNEDIMWIFLVESGFIGFIGGIFGLVLGLALSFISKIAVETAGGPRILLSISWELLVFGLMFAFLLGMASGVIPALRAANMSPVKALRYE